MSIDMGRFSDVLVVPHRGNVRDEKCDGVASYLDNAVRLSPNLWVGCPANLDLNVVMDACEPRGHEFKPVRQFGYYYALLRPVDDAHGWEDWDWDHTIIRTIAFSRLV